MLQQRLQRMHQQQVQDYIAKAGTLRWGRWLCVAAIIAAIAAAAAAATAAGSGLRCGGADIRECWMAVLCSRCSTRSSTQQQVQVTLQRQRHSGVVGVCKELLLQAAPAQALVTVSQGCIAKTETFKCQTGGCNGSSGCSRCRMMMMCLAELSRWILLLWWRSSNAAAAGAAAAATTWLAQQQHHQQQQQ
jgi:hypothetical protein